MPVRRQRQCLEYRHHRAQAGIFAAAPAGTDARTHRGASRSSGRGPAERFEAPGLNALNFLISDALGGGGMASRRIDPQGKAYGQMALEMTIPVPCSWAAQLAGQVTRRV
jgi:hypothetical protein